MEPMTSSRRALGTAIFIWASSMAALALGGLLTGVWHISDLWGRAGAAFLGEFGLIATVGTFLFIGGPVFVWLRYGLVVPILVLVSYFGYWAFLGVSTGVGFSALYVAVMYGLLALVGIAVLSLIEWILRTARSRQVQPAN